MNGEITISFEIVSITEESFTPVQIDSSRTIDDRSQLKVSTQMHTDIATKEQMIKIHSGVKYQIQDDTIASLSICMAYRVSPFDEIIRIDKDKKQINFSADFISPLLCSTYDTMRGIFHEKTKDTFLSKYSVPLTSPAMLASFNKFKVVDD